MDWWVLEEIQDDLNTSATISKMHQLAKGKTAGQLKSAMQLLGFPLSEQLDWWRQEIVTLAGTASTGTTPLYTKQIIPFLELWQKLRLERDYEGADELKKRLEATGLQISNSKSGPTATIPFGFNPAKLDALL